MFNPGKALKLKNAWDIFSRNHPKFPKYMDAVMKTAIEEGTIIEINVTTADGKKLNSNIKLTESDIQVYRELSQLK